MRYYYCPNFWASAFPSYGTGIQENQFLLNQTWYCQFDDIVSNGRELPLTTYVKLKGFGRACKPTQYYTELNWAGLMIGSRILMAWNIFRLCRGLRALGSFMILAVLAIVAVSYYAVVISTYGPQLLQGGTSLAVALPILIIFHILLVMLLWCYFMAVFTDPGSVPQNWRPATDEDDTEAQIVPLSTATLPSGVTVSLEAATGNGTTQISGGRYCRKCSHYKPPRCHHCSICGRCVLKMDHHCVWIVNCVGARNYKFFLLFIFYTFLETMLDTLVLLPHFIAFFDNIGQHSDSAIYLATTFLAFVLNVAFALSLLGFLILHANLLASNTTTIEAHEKKHTPRWRYDLGVQENFRQVFGSSKLYWFLPVYADEDMRRMPVLQGLDYPVRPDSEG